MEQVLYRKYRPQTFNEVLGQDHIVSVLEASIREETFGHAYLFTGSRGTGKTSVARIFARALKTNPEDIIEIDAASNRGIDDIRALREAVQTLPFSSSFKIYIIDEVHMLTKEAWAALLKTLEEPPGHIVFILATTELEKVPDTILSRCQVFAFKRPTERLLVELVKSVAEREGRMLDEESAASIAFLGDGSFRDTFGVLQKVFSVATGKTINASLVETITGAPPRKIVHQLIEGLLARDLEGALVAIKEAASVEADMSMLVKLLLGHVRHILLYRYAPKLRQEIEAEHAPTTFELISRAAVEGGAAITSQAVVALITALERSSYAAVPELPLELAFIELLSEKPSK